MAASPFSYPRFRWLFVLGALLWMGLHAWVLYSWGWAAKAALLDSLVSNGLLAMASLGIATTLRFYLPSTNRYMFLLALSGVLCLAWFLLTRLVLMVLPDYVDDYRQFWSASTPLRLSVGFLVLGSNTLMHVLWYTLQQHREDDQRRNEMEALAREAELYHLREQLHPHFLFNSLNSIHALVGSRPEEARHMVQQLSDFLRGTLRTDHKQWRSLEEELHHLQLYLEVEKVRFGHRLNTEVIADEAASNARIPVMLLQPVVENAIKFGLYDTTEAVTIRIQAQLDNNRLVLMVTNPYDPQTVSRKKGTGFGLRSIERRLYLLFAQPGLMETQAREHEFITTLKIPQTA